MSRIEEYKKDLPQDLVEKLEKLETWYNDGILITPEEVYLMVALSYIKGQINGLQEGMQNHSKGV